MTTVRSRSIEKQYQKYLKHRIASCDFCQIKEGDEHFITATQSFKIIRNLFPYSFWDDQAVGDHLLIVPKEHIESLSSFSPKEATEYLKLISDYEMNGYHVYARAVKSISRSIPHQHTHLIKCVGKGKSFVLQLTKPHITIAW